MAFSSVWHVSTARPVREEIAYEVSVPDVKKGAGEDVSINCPSTG
jgi:hypothetical protein